MITLRDIDYVDNKIEMIIDFTNRKFDGEIHKSIVNIKFRFGIQCLYSDQGLYRDFNQEINNSIIWTEYDIERLINDVNICINSNYKDKYYYLINVLEPEFEAVYIFLTEDLINLFVTVGMSGIGSTIKLVVTKDELLRWISEIKNQFYK